MTIGIRPGSKRVNGARIRQYGKAGGARSGQQAGLGSTIGKNGWMIKWIKRRVNSLASESTTKPSRSEQLISAVGAGDDLPILLGKGFTLDEILGNQGLFSSAELLLKSVNNPKQKLNDVGIGSSQLRRAGAINKGNLEYDFSDFLFKELLIQNPLLPPRYVLAAINDELLALGITGTSELSTTTKLKVGSEIMQVYAELSEYQKNDLENQAVRENSDFAGKLAAGMLGVFFTFFQ